MSARIPHRLVQQTILSKRRLNNSADATSRSQFSSVCSFLFAAVQ
jgi:hypothetical protein